MDSINVDEETAGSKTGRRCNYWCAGGLLFFIGVVGLTIVLSLYVQIKIAYCSRCTGRLQYGVIIDAGSSKSKLSLFRWNGDKLRGTGEVTEITDCKAGDKGIATYKDKPEEAGKSLVACINEATRKIPDERESITPIYLGATAGMRILEQNDPDKAEKVLNSVKETFKKTFLKNSPNNVRIVKEQEEGSYAWTAANLVQRTLGQDGEKVPTTGTLDMGGASMQIAFETTEQNKTASPNDFISLRLYGHEFTVFTHSYLCFGQDQIINRAKVQIMLNSPSSGTSYSHPCLHRNHQVEIKVQDLFYQTCTVPVPPELNFLSNETKIVFGGTGDVEKCYELLDELLDPTNCETKGYKHCFKHDFIPEITGNFIAMSSFLFAYDYLTKNEIITSQQDYRNVVEKYCKEEWSVVEKRGNDTKQPGSYMSAYCFTGLFTHKLIGGIFGLGGDRWQNVTFTGKIGGVSVGWSLGFMANATNTIPTENIGKEPEVLVGVKTTDIFIVLVVIFVVLMLIVLITSYRAWTQRTGGITLYGDRDKNNLLSLCCPKQ